MGAYSSVVEDDIEVKDKKGLKEFIKRFNKKFSKTYELPIKDMDFDNFNFQWMDGWKVISYWYCETVCLFYCIAKYIDGYVKFEYETHEEFAIINFDSGKCSIQIGEVDYETYAPDKLRNMKTKEIEEFMLVEDI